MQLNGARVKLFQVVCIGAMAWWAVATASVSEVTVVKGVLGPEGPLYVDGNLYFVGWVSNTLSKWDGKASTVLNTLAGCGHNGLALTYHKTFLVACTDEHGAILELDLNGKQLHRWDADAKGTAIAGGINDVVVTANGGAYATVVVARAGQHEGRPRGHHQRRVWSRRERPVCDGGEGPQ
jgi:sugar lactone lactonase YvrE